MIGQSLGVCRTSLGSLLTINGISRIIVALSYADRKYIGPYEGPEYLMSGELSASPLSSQTSAFCVFHAPFIWPMIMQYLRKLELHVPAIVYDLHGAVIFLPRLRDLRHYGHITPETTRLPQLHTPFLKYLEIMHRVWSFHPVLLQVDRRWLNVARKPITHPDYHVAWKTAQGTSRCGKDYLT